MKKLFCCAFFTVMFLVGAFSTELSAEDRKPSWAVDATAGLFSDYMWRGFNLYDGTSIQPALNVAYSSAWGETTGNLWMHLSGENDNGPEKFTELDATISHAITFEPVTVKVGAVWYTYPDDDDNIDNTGEFFGSVSLDDGEYNSLITLSPTLSVYHDYDEYDAQYYELGLSHKFESDTMGKGFAFTPYVAVGFASNAEKYYADNGIVQATYGVAFEANVGDVVVAPSINRTSELDDNAKSEFWFGTNFTYSFQ